MRELDMLLLRYLDREFSAAAPPARAAFERLLTAQDPEILDLLAGRAVTDDEALHEVVQRLLAQSRQ
jgi:antitoxin CptB